MTEPADQIARAAARRLAIEANRPLLGAEVERCLDLRAESEPGTYEPVTLSIAALVVSIAGLAWTICNDLRKAGGQIGPEVLSRRIRVAVEQRDDVDEGERDRIIDVVVEETLSNPRRGKFTAG